MYLCICHQITEEQVRNQLGSGKSPKEIARSLGVGTDCGVCIIDGIEKLIVNTELRIEMGKNGKDSIKKFSAENVLDRWEKLIKEVVKV